uniref:Uncharacterized protein n=1 Tax=Tanacetum cinerariifolium TaxID=118510 RepID=A0A699WDC5_TANCI|nr:hypothetical protein [Tanacetum cinerariifolium]
MGMRLTGSLLEMYTPRGGSSLSLISDYEMARLQAFGLDLRKLSNLTVEERRPLTGSGKLPEEAQPDEARHVLNRSEVT